MHQACTHFDEHNVNGQDKKDFWLSSDRISLPANFQASAQKGKLFPDY
jgi:hypothetical protein